MSDEAVRKSRELNPNCGCERRGDRQFSCSYHEGFIDGCEAARSAAIQECADKADELEKEWVGAGPTISSALLALKER